MSSIAATIELEVLGFAPIQVASALIDYADKVENDKDNQLILIEEIADHLNAYCKAERKRWQ